jgi:hypothetical protein
VYQHGVERGGVIQSGAQMMIRREKADRRSAAEKLECLFMRRTRIGTSTVEANAIDSLQLLNGFVFRNQKR